MRKSIAVICFRWSWALILVVMLSADIATAQNPGSRWREFPPGSLSRVDQLPAGRFRAQLEQLSPAARDNALRWLGRIHFTEADLPALRADASGGIYFVCETAVTGPDVSPVPANEAPVILEAAVPVNPLPVSLKFHSRPGAPNVIYLNFTGETVTGTAWNVATNIMRDPIVAVPMSFDGDYANFSDAEQLAIRRIWQRVAEDYAPFNVDVTTERPATLGTRVANVVITRSTDTNGAANPSSGAGGVAYVDVFGLGNFSYYRPAWVYVNNLGPNNEAYIAEAASHEAGHNFGLSHDATPTSAYYGGHGSGETSWGPLMGTGYNRNVSQWSKGDYFNANNTEDDLATLNTKISYRPDDIGNTNSTAAALVLSGGTNIVATTPETDPTNTNTANKGVIERNTDVDVFSFTTGSGGVRLAVNPWVVPGGTTRGGNLDVSLELRDILGTVLATNNPATQTGATIQTNLARGQYFLHVRNTGAGLPTNSSPSGYTAYGSLGQYFVSGYVTALPPPVSYVLYSADLNTNPGWTLQPEWEYGAPGYASGTGPTSGFTGSNIIGYNLDGNYLNNLASKYATTPSIDCSGQLSVTLRFRRWLGLRSGDTASIQVSSDGSTWVTVWSTTSEVADSSWVLQEFVLPSGIAGSPTVRLRWGLASNSSLRTIGWNLDDIELIGDTPPDIEPPTVALTVASLTTGGAPSHPVSVNFSDVTAVRRASLGSDDLLVTGPNNYSNLAAFVSANLVTDATPIVATYSIPGPGGGWDWTDNGNYPITLRAGSVDDTLGNAVATTNLGTLTVSIPVPAPGVLAVSPAAGLSATGFAGGPFSPSSQVYTLTNSGGSSLTWTVTNSQPWLTLSATNGNLPPGGSVPVTALVNNGAVGLSAGNYADTIQFRNLTAGLDIERSVELTVEPLPTFTLTATATPDSWGAVSPTGGVYTTGAAVQLQATPATYFQFAGWSGDVVDTNNPLLLTVTTNRSLVAGFSEIFTTNYPTPHWWLASYGYTNDFESVVTEIGVNGHALWQSYIAGLEPTNAASRLWLNGILAADGSSLVLNWNTVTGRVYSVWGSAFIDSGFAPVPAATDLPWTVTSFTNALDAGTGGQFYRLEVRKP